MDCIRYFGSYTGTTHFHIACIFRSLHVIKSFLEQGISPDLLVEDALFENFKVQKGDFGLTIAASSYINFPMCPQLARLLIQYGANIEQKDKDNKAAF